MTDLTRKLPLELLSEILTHDPIQDVLRFKQVNRTARDAIVASPLLQHKIDLFAAGLKHNPAPGIDLADSRRALLQYRSNLHSLRPKEARTVDSFRSESGLYPIVVGDVCGVVEDSVRLFTLGSTSRGEPHEEWKIPIPVVNLARLCFYPGADVIAFIELPGLNDMGIKIHLRTLSNGSYHPAALFPIIHHSRRSDAEEWIWSTSITNSRLVVLSTARNSQLTIWDWRSGQVLFESGEERYGVAEFVDDHRLLVNLQRTSHGPPSLVLIDTGKNVGGAPLWTFFHFSAYFTDAGPLALQMERGAHEPSPAESLASFHRDPAQRIALLHMLRCSKYLILRVGALLELLEIHEGSEIEWDRWRGCLAVPSINAGLRGVWVSGCRLFSFTYPTDSSADLKMEACAIHRGESITPAGLQHSSS